MTDFSNVANPLTEEAAASADRSGAPPAIYNHALFSRVFQLQETVAGLGDLSALESDVAALQGDVTSLQGDVSSAQGDITSLQGDVSSAQGDISTLQGETASLLPAGQIRVPVSLVANSTWATYVPATKFGATVTALKLVTPTVFASTAGTVLLSVKKNSSGGNTLLSTATADLETVSADTLTALTLTATAGDKVLTDSDMLYVAIVSDDADATGPADAAACLVVEFTYTLD